jgi:RND family efflux transporter MFP subunit
MKIKPALIIVPLLLAAAACRHKKNGPEIIQPVPVEVTEVKARQFQYVVRSSGRLSASLEQKLSFKTGGLIRDIYVSEGQSVKKGDLLARLDLSEIQSHVNQAGEAFDKAERDYNRVVNLYNDGVATLEQLQNAKTMFQVAKSDLDIASFNLLHSSIVAPSNGSILRKLAEVNEMTAPGIPVFLFGSTEGSWIVRIHATDRDRVNLGTGDSARISLDAYPDMAFPAFISELAGLADPYTGTFEVELTLEPAQGYLFLTGMIARAVLYSGHSRQVASVPADAMMNATGKSAQVFVVTDGIPIRKKITILEIRPDEILVEPDLKPGSLVIVENLSSVSDSAAIQIIK